MKCVTTLNVLCEIMMTVVIVATEAKIFICVVVTVIWSVLSVNKKKKNKKVTILKFAQLHVNISLKTGFWTHGLIW